MSGRRRPHGSRRLSRVDHWHVLDLGVIVEAGYGDIPLVQLPLRCSACGQTGHKIIISGRSYGLGSEGSGR
jgi:hypothetical protein